MRIVTIIPFHDIFAIQNLMKHTYDMYNNTSTNTDTNNTSSHTNRRTATTIIYDPEDMDILCGRDRNYYNHPGNRIYRQMIAQQSLNYISQSSKIDKMKITKSIVQTMQSHHGSRFIRRRDHSESWEVLSDTQARDKTSHALRFHNSNKKQANNNVDYSCITIDNEIVSNDCYVDQLWQHFGDIRDFDGSFDHDIASLSLPYSPLHGRSNTTTNETNIEPISDAIKISANSQYIGTSRRNDDETLKQISESSQYLEE